MIPARQSTALELAIGPVLDADGVAVTGCVVGDFKIKKTTGNFAALNGSATLTHVSAGVYDLVLTTSDTDTVGLTTIAIDDTVNACASIYLQVIEEAVYDRDYAASATGIIGTAQTADNNTILAHGTYGLSALKTLIDAKSSQASVDDLPTNAELTAALAAADDAVLAAIAALNNVSAAAVAAAVRTNLATELARIDVANSTRMASFTLPTNFSALGVNASGHVSRVTLVDTTTTNTDAMTAATTRDALGMAAADLDDQLDAIAASSAPTADEIADEVETRELIVGEFTAGALNQISSLRRINVQGTVASTGRLELVQGDDYLTTDGRQLIFTNTAGSWSNLTGATITLRLKVGTQTVETSGTVITPTGTGQRVDVNLTDTVSAQVAVGRGLFEVEALLSTGSHETLENGVLKMTAQLG